MAGLNVAQVGAELGQYIKHQESIDAVKGWFYQEDELSQYAETVSKVDGSWPAHHDVITNVVQEFAPVWNELGEMQVRTKLLKAFKQKVNFPIVPAVLVGTWVSFLYREGLKAEQHPISRYIVNKLGEKVKEDLSELMATGVYTPGTGSFGDSMDGALTILANMLVSGNPFRIPIPVLTDLNIVYAVEAYVKMIPSKARKKCKAIFMSEQNLFRYQERYRELFGRDTDFTKEGLSMTRFGKMPIVGLSSWDGSDTIMATVNGNMVKLIDVEDKPRFTDVQTLDYKVKLFMEFTLGLEFWMDEAVYLPDYGGTVRGLAANHSVYYPQTPTSVIAPKA